MRRNGNNFPANNAEFWRTSKTEEPRGRACNGYYRWDKRVDKRILTGYNRVKRQQSSRNRIVHPFHPRETLHGRGVSGCARREEENYEESLKKGVVEGPKERLSPAAAAPTVGSLFMVPVRRWCGTHHLFYPRASRYRTHFSFGHLFPFFPRENPS